MQRVSIVGLGLIGSSIGLGLRRWSSKDGKRDAVLEISGFDTSLDVQNYAKKLKAVDRTEWNLPSAIASADFLVIATPVMAVREVFEVIAKHGKEGLVVTDTASTKAEVMRWASEILPAHVNFIGGHPMAGKSLSVEGADAELFKSATWCVAPSVTATEEAVQTVLGMIAALEAEALFVDPHEHDGFVGGISHLPFLLSAALMRTVSKDAGWRDMRKLSSTGFRDASRLASGSPEMHRDIALTNKESLLRWTDAAIAELASLRELVASGDEAALEAAFNQARDARAEWMVQERGAGELVQDVDDELPNFNLGEQMQQMLFGGLFRRKPRTGREERAGSPRR
ncbi:MAG TPA: prephenate dehydrogenase/arogenate dehydrogenase family protein [Nitrolancea sp.]|nr:prephenate dehydrogenase/arogenate dehydrogenase family protein [Nitrolancea sp.]